MLPKFIIYEHGCPSWNVTILDFFVGDLIYLERYQWQWKLRFAFEEPPQDTR